MTSEPTNHRPLIGLTGRRKKAGQIVGTPEILHDLDGDWFYADYARGVFEAGGLPVNLPLDVDPALYVDRLDGLLLSGGADIGASRYGATPGEADDPAEEERDAFELALFSAAKDKQLPVLGICRGLQLVNVASGGTLHQHVPAHAGFAEPPATLLHDVDFAPGSVLSSIYEPRHQVNSLHHQTVDKVGAGLVVTASHEGSVEGLEHSSLPIVAVQWHPEMLPTRANDPIFSWLVGAASWWSRHPQSLRSSAASPCTE